MKTSLMLTVIIWIALLYTLICAAAYFYQEKLLFPGAVADPALYINYSTQQIRLQRGEALLQGWHIENPASTNAHVGIYFGGNGEDVISMLPVLQKLNVRHIYTFNYRGYGYSEGKASENFLYEDALAIYADIKSRHINSDEKIVVFGRSLGSAVAGYLATQKDVAGLVLMTPLNSAIQNGKRMLPFVPVSLLIRHPFDLKSQAAKINCPVLMLIANADQVIPPKDSLATYAVIRNPKELVHLPGVGHNNLFDNPNALKAIQNFITKTGHAVN